MKNFDLRGFWKSVLFYLPVERPHDVQPQGGHYQGVGKYLLLNSSLFLCNYPSLWKRKKNMVWCVFRWVGFLFVKNRTCFIAVYDHCFCLVLVVHRQCTISKFIAMLKLSWPRCHRKPTIGHPILKIKTVRQLINHHTFKNRFLPMNE